jgi:dolichol-phosphate mannosyltransferase
VRAKVVDIPMRCKYGDEISNLQIYRVIHEFLWKNLRNACARISYPYFVRDFSIASIELVVGILFATFGTVFGSQAWIGGVLRNQAATAGTIMLAALPITLGIQLLISFLSYDIAAAPGEPIGHKLPRRP